MWKPGVTDGPLSPRVLILLQHAVRRLLHRPEALDVYLQLQTLSAGCASAFRLTPSVILDILDMLRGGLQPSPVECQEQE